MKRASIIIALVGIALAVSSDASAQTNDHFARQRREAAANRETAARATSARHWGGPTTNHRWYPNQGSRHGTHNHGTHNHSTTFIRQNVQYVPVSPFGFGYPAYGYPRYNNPGYGGGWNPYYGYPRYGYGQNIHIHREIILK